VDHRTRPDAAIRLLSALTSEFKNNELDPKVIEFWLTIAAENGSPNAQHAYAQILWKAFASTAREILGESLSRARISACKKTAAYI
jgi:hypothetical protein